MNKYFLSLTILLLFNICNNIDIENVIKLPEPKKQGGMPLFDALSIRHSSRDFNDSIKVTPEIISQALWSCYGVREGNYRVIPAAKAWYTFVIYLFVEDGVYKYNPIDHAILKIIDGDHRKITGTDTAIVTKAPVSFCFIADLNMKGRPAEDKTLRRDIAKVDIGNLTMALSLFAAANNMKGVIRGNFNQKDVFEFLNLNSNDYYMPLAFSLGY